MNVGLRCAEFLLSILGLTCGAQVGNACEAQGGRGQIENALSGTWNPQGPPGKPQALSVSLCARLPTLLLREDKCPGGSLPVPLVPVKRLENPVKKSL